MQLLLPELLQAGVESIRRTLERRPVASLSSRDVEDAIFLLLSGVESYGRAWAALLEKLERGLVMRHARMLAEAHAGLCDTELGCCALLESLAMDLALAHDLKGLAELRTWAEEVRRHRAACARLIAAADTPPPPFNPEVIAAWEACRARGEDPSEDIEDLIARLQAGGEQ
jgi:hypothetical protein